MNKNWIVSAGLGIMLGLGTFVWVNPQSLAFTASQSKVNLNEMRVEIGRLIEQNPQLGFSSNPYKYTENNQVFDRIVGYGYEALPLIEEEITKGDTYGLEKYIFAIAAERIAKVDLKQSPHRWSHAEEFVRSWRLHLQAVPSEVERIAVSQQSGDEKIKSLVKLGVPAIPYILEKVDAGHKDMAPALRQLIPESDASGLKAESDATAYKQWAHEHQEQVELLRSLVNKAVHEPETNNQFLIRK